MDKEIQGDWSNLKGTVYHLVYAMRELLTGGVSEVRFFEGNDLLARPGRPPRIDDAEALPAVAAVAMTGDKDIWIQLKFTEDRWTVTKLLDEKLLGNFISNALHSERQGRDWVVRLVTPGIVAVDDLTDYLQNPTNHDGYNRDLKKAIADVQDRHKDQGLSMDGLDDDRPEELATRVLRQLAATVPVRLETLKAEVERDIILVYPSRETALQIANTLLGGMLAEAGQGPGQAPPFNPAWVDAVAGRDLRARRRLVDDPVGVCTAAVAAATQDWDSARHADRPDLRRALDRFLASSEVVFALVGRSGAGKSWALAEWANRGLAGRVRLLVRRVDSRRLGSLGSLIAPALREFGPLAWRDEQFAEHLKAGAAVDGRGPLVLVIDDLVVDRGSTDQVARDLAELAQQARIVRAKLVIGCLDTDWNLHHVGEELDPDIVFRSQHAEREIDGGQSRDREAPKSYDLEGLTDDELTGAVGRRLPADRAATVAEHLRSPAFAPLRHPYLLNLYLEEHGPRLCLPHGVPAPVDVAALLDHRVNQAIRAAARVAGTSALEARAAFSGLVDLLWSKRPVGATSREAVDVLATMLSPGQSEQILSALRQEGLLTTDPPLQFAEPVVAEQLFATALNARLTGGDPVLDGLQAALDTSVVSALLRDIQDPLPIADRLLASDAAWTKAVADGLAQGDADDARALSLLTALAGPDASGHLGSEALDALGYLAARSRRAQKWVAQLYLSGRSVERTLGQVALAATVNLAPDLVGAAVRLRLSRARRMPSKRHADRRRRDKLLGGSLAPLASISSRRAADTAQRLLDRYGNVAGEGEASLGQDFSRGVDEACGMIAMTLAGDQLDGLLAGLKSGDPTVRFRTAWALYPVAVSRPELVAGPLCDAIRTEGHGAVMGQLLWDAAPLTKADPDAVLDAVTGGWAIDWSIKPVTTGQALSLLSELVDAAPERVQSLLPPKLEGYDPDLRALHAEALAYAWWRVAERLPVASETLAALATPDTELVEDDCLPFAFRGAAIAQLGLMCLGIVSSAELLDSHFLYKFREPEFVFLWTDRFARRHAAHLARHDGSERLRRILLDCISSENRIEQDPRKKQLQNSAFLCAHRCLEMLVLLATELPDPLEVLGELPRNWQALRAAWRTLDLGRGSEAVIAFAKEAAEEHAIDGVTEGSDERDRCLAVIASAQARLTGEPRAALADHRASLRHTLGVGTRQAEAIARISEGFPGEFLALLNDSIVDEEDAPTLYHLDEVVRPWSQRLVARVYRRMFDPAPISAPEAIDLCRQMLTGVTALRELAERVEYERVYEALLARLAGRTHPPATLGDGQSRIEQSHHFAVALLGGGGFDVDGGGDADAVSERLEVALVDDPDDY